MLSLITIKIIAFVKRGHTNGFNLSSKNFKKISNFFSKTWNFFFLLTSIYLGTNRYGDSFKN